MQGREETLSLGYSDNKNTLHQLMAYSSVIYGSAEANSKVLTGKWCAYPAPACWGGVPKADGIHIREKERAGGVQKDEIELYRDKLKSLLLYFS